MDLKSIAKYISAERNYFWGALTDPNPMDPVLVSSVMARCHTEGRVAAYENLLAYITGTAQSSQWAEIIEKL